MGLLARLAAFPVALSAACYAPDVRDCTVKCAGPDDCAGDQVCSAGFCVASAEIQCTSVGGGGSGGGGNGSGGGNSPPDAGGQVVVADAGVDAPADAPARGTLSVTVEGKGAISIAGVGVCDSQCTYSVSLASPLTAKAIPGDDFMFEKWTTSSVCPVDVDVCTFVPQLTSALGAKFRKDN